MRSSLLRFILFPAMLFAIVGRLQAEDGFGYYKHQNISNPERSARSIVEDGFSIRGYEAFSMQPPIDWAADPYKDINWQYQLNGMYPLAPAFQVLMGDGNRSYLEFVREVFLDWVRFNIEDDKPNSFRWNDMATGVRANYLAQLIWLERREGKISEIDMERLVNAGRLHLVELADPDKFSAYNHGLFQLIGIASLCQLGLYPECESMMKYAGARYEELFWLQFNGEAMHLEHSPEYHLFAYKVFKKIEDSGLLKLSGNARTVFERVPDNLHWMVHPDGGFAAIGDTESRHARNAAKFDPKALWLTSGGVQGREPEYGAKSFPDTGYSFVRMKDKRGNDSYVMFSVAHHSSVHKHADTFSFEWSDQGRRILVDSGKWGYDAGPARNYIVGVNAHNTVRVGERGYSRKKIPQILSSSARTEDGVAMLNASAKFPRSVVDTEQERWLLLSPGEWLIVADEIRNRWPWEELVQWFHFPPEAQVTKIGGRFEVRFPWTDSVLYVFSTVPVTGVEALRGVKGDQWYGWYSPEYRKLEPSWQIGFRNRAFSGRFVTVFRWIEPGEALPSVPETQFIGWFSSGNYEYCWRESGSLNGRRMDLQQGVWRLHGCD